MWTSQMLWSLLSASSIVLAQQNYGGFVCTGKSSEYTAKTVYLGCVTDSDDRTLSGRMTSSAANTPQSCANDCAGYGFKYSAVEYASQCFCGNTINPIAKNASESSCSTPCAGDASKDCGGTYFMNLYQISNPNPNPEPLNAQRQPVCKTNPFCAQKACDTSLSIADRVKALISNMTLAEKVYQMVDGAAGVTRLGLPPYEWWSEALHGVAGSPGVSFTSPNGSEFSYATSFPEPILMGAAFDDALINAVASIVGKEARAFGNYLHSGLDFWTPNINTFLDPRWGRGLEVATEDSYHMQNYVKALIPGLQGGLNAGASKQIIATCKHYAVYDVETNRYGQNYDATQQDLGEYYLQAFKTCVRDAHVGSIMCSYNAVDGVPSCASEYLLQDVLRDNYGFTEPYRYVTSDCGAVSDIFTNHKFTYSAEAASAVALNAGTDVDCGTNYLNLNVSVAENMTTEATMDRSLTRLYNALFTVGYFDGQPQYDGISWKDVSTPPAQALAYQAAWEGMTLLKNDGLLPLETSQYKNVALVGPWANATGQMQGNYQGTAPFLHSPLEAAKARLKKVSYVVGTPITSSNDTGFADAITAAKAADLIIFMGGIDTSIEAEGMDRTTITWPSNQINLINQLAGLKKPMVIVQFGGGQLDDSQFLKNKNINSILWAGYPGQDGGYAVLDTLVGMQAPAGRLPVTQYPANYINQISLFDPNLRPNGTSPGRTYKWYNGKSVLPFGYGLHYTKFGFKWTAKPKQSYDISSLVQGSKTDASPFVNLAVQVTNTGKVTSDYVGLVFMSTENAGPAPYPNKWLASYARAHGIAPGASQTIQLPLNLGSIARANKQGDLIVYPGKYQVMFDTSSNLNLSFTLVGKSRVLEMMPRQATQYNYTVPVHPQ